MRDRIVAHRGNAAECRENTLEAIQSAIDLGCRYVEFDVHMSIDCVPHLLHDSYLTRLWGKDREAFDTRSDALAGYGIPRLQDASALLRRYPDVTAFVDVKPESLRRFGRESVIRSVCDLLDSAQCVLISFDLDSLEIARNHGFRIGAAILDATLDIVERCKQIAPDYMFCDQSRVTFPLWRGPRWVAWEVASTAVAQSLLSRGFSLLETMQVRKLMEAND